MATKANSAKIDRKDLRAYSQVLAVASAGIKAPELFAERRELQRQALAMPMLFAGIEREPGAENLWWMNGVRLVQDPALLWLCGINQTGIRVLIHPQGASMHTLYLPFKRPEKEFWDGVRLGLYEPGHAGADEYLQFLKNLTGFERIVPSSQMEEDLLDLGLSELGVFAHHYVESQWGMGGQGSQKIDSDHHALFYKSMQKWGKKHGVKVQAFAKEHMDLRVIQDKFQVKDAEEATLVAKTAFDKLLAKWDRHDNENELSRRLEYYMLRQSPWGLAFPTICASGRGACTLHYLKNDEPLAKGSLVLLDFGARFGTQHSDISRTLPVNGCFNPLQALLYQIVLDAQKLNEDFLRPGVLLTEANDRVWNFIEEELKAKFLARGGKMTRSYEMRPHGVSHLMGEQEHEGDPFRLYAREPLREGMLLSNEPGLYGHFEMVLGGKKYSEWIGIRIEDNLLITKKGCRNLSSAIPKEIHELEKLIQRKDAPCLKRT